MQVLYEGKESMAEVLEFDKVKCRHFLKCGPEDSDGLWLDLCQDAAAVLEKVS